MMVELGMKSSRGVQWNTYPNRLRISLIHQGHNNSGDAVIDHIHMLYIWSKLQEMSSGRRSKT